MHYRNIGDEKKIFEFHHSIKDAIKIYQSSLPAERRSIIDQYEPMDIARKVVGVGSVGTKAYADQNEADYEVCRREWGEVAK